MVFPGFLARVTRRTEQKKIGPDRLFSSVNLCLLLHNMRRGFLAGGVDEFEGESVAFTCAREIVASGSGDWRDDRLVATEQGVEEPGFAGVWGADENDSGKAVDSLTGVEAIREREELPRTSRQALGEFEAAEWVDVGFVVEVEVGFEVGERVEKLVAERGDGVEKSTRELLQGGVKLRGVSCFDHTENGLRSSEVELTVQEGPESEFARLGHPRALFKALGQYESEQCGSAKGVDLGEGLTSVRVRARPEEQVGR